jgi:hypothetical protein
MGLLESPLGMRWTTLLMVLVILVVIGVGRRRPLVAVAAVGAWTGGFEVVYRFWDIVRWHEWWGLHDLMWEAAALVAWVILAHALGVRPSAFWLTVTLLGFGIWITTGYTYNYVGQRYPFSVTAEIQNVATKTAWAIAYLVGAWRLGIGDPAAWLRSTLARVLAPGSGRAIS